LAVLVLGWGLGPTLQIDKTLTKQTAAETNASFQAEACEVIKTAITTTAHHRKAPSGKAAW